MTPANYLKRCPKPEAAACRRNLLTVVLLSVLFGITGCTVGPDYVKPEVSAPTAFRYEAAAETDIPMPVDGWWELFGDEALSELIRTAEAENFDLKAAAERVLQARAVARISRAPMFPFFTAEPYSERRQTSKKIDPDAGTGSVYAVPFTVGYELDLFGRIRRSYESGLALAEASAEDLSAVRLVLQTDIATHYFALRSLDEDIRIVSRAIEIREEQIRLLGRRQELGVISRLPLAQAEAELKATEALRYGLLRNRANLENAIAVLTGKAPSEASVSEYPLQSEPPAVPRTVPSSLLIARPDIRSVERQLAAASARIGVAQAAFYPQISIGADIGTAGTQLGDLFESDGVTWGFGPRIRIPLFEGGKNQAELDRAESRFREVAAVYRQTILRAFGEVEDALVSTDLLGKQAVANALAVDSAEQAYGISRRQFEGGLINYLSVLDSERTLLDNMRLGSQIRGLRFLAAVRLIKSIGGRWGQTTGPADDS